MNCVFKEGESRDLNEPVEKKKRLQKENCEIIQVSVNKMRKSRDANRKEMRK